MTRFFVDQVVFTTSEVKMGPHTRPILAELAKSTLTGNRTGVGAVDRMNRLPDNTDEKRNSPETAK